jgi:hypothetical protein
LINDFSWPGCSWTRGNSRKGVVALAEFEINSITISVPERVQAEFAEVDDLGTLLFVVMDGEEGRLVAAYAPGQWVSFRRL